MNEESLLHVISDHKVFCFTLFGYDIEIYNSVIVIWIIIAVLVLLSALATRREFALVPAGVQNAVEIVVETVNSFTRSMVGQHWMGVAPFIGTIFIFLVSSNMVSIFNFVPDWEQLHRLTGLEFFMRIPQIQISPPTRNINVTMALGVISTMFVIYFSIRFNKVSGWLRSFIRPSPVVLPVRFMEYFIRIVSLSFRLFGNILGAFIIMELVYMYVPAIIPAAFSIYFDIFDGALQAFIFVFLTLLYISEAVEE